MREGRQPRNEPHDVRLDHLSEDIGGRLFELGEERDWGVVDSDVDPPEGLEALLCQGVNGCLVGHIGWRHQGSDSMTLVFGRNLAEEVFTPRSEHQRRHTAARKVKRGGAANPA